MLDEPTCAQKDAIEAMRREALNETNNLKSVIVNMDTQLQLTRRELEQAVNVEAKLRDTISVAKREAEARSSSGTLPQPPPQQPSIPVDVVARVQDIMVRERKETTSMLTSRLEAFSDLAENRERSIRDELKLVKSETND